MYKFKNDSIKEIKLNENNKISFNLNEINLNFKLNNEYIKFIQMKKKNNEKINFNEIKEIFNNFYETNNYLKDLNNILKNKYETFINYTNNNLILIKDNEKIIIKNVKYLLFELLLNKIIRLINYLNNIY